MMKKKNAIFRRITVFLILFLLALLITDCISQNGSKDVIISSPLEKLEVHFIDVGQGDAILVENNDADMLIDAGDNDKGDIVADYLKSEHIKDLDYVVGTHPHSDHIGGMDTILNTFPAEDVIIPSVENGTKTYKDVLEIIKAKNLKVSYARAGERFALGDASFIILAPNSSSYEDLNNYSVCIKLTFGRNSFLFTGDAEELSEKEMLMKGYDLSADVLKLGHHGSAYSSSKAFLDAVNPTYGIISAGRDNSNGHPHSRTLKSLKKHGIRFYRTDRQGTIIVTSDGKNISFNKSAFK